MRNPIVRNFQARHWIHETRKLAMQLMLTYIAFRSLTTFCVWREKNYGRNTY